MHLTTKSGRKIKMNTPEEDAIITRQAKEDGTYRTEEELSKVDFKPVSEIPGMQGLLKANRGRPKSDNPKLSVTVRYDANIIEFFKATGKGWQSRMNEVLREYIANH